MVDLLDEKVFRKKLDNNLLQKNLYLVEVLKEKSFGFSEIFNEYLQYKARLEKYVKDTSLFLSEEIEKGRHILFEGAQGGLLDLDHGTYPYVTASNTVAGNACAGSGIGPRQIDSVIGVVKAYTTRVGEGPFPTELKDGLGERIRERGGEYGATTGRPRRCGWFDAVIVNHSIRINDIQELALTKLDVLNDFDKINVCVGYRLNGKVSYHVPSSIEMLERAEPVYEELDGWKAEIKEARDFSDLPANAKRYIRRIEELTQTKITIISVGSERNETIKLKDPFMKSKGSIGKPVPKPRSALRVKRRKK
jgi:adenylosuccinate synthase